jgi:hypothetical protein
MFDDVQTTDERGDRLENLKKALGDSIARRDSKADAFVPKMGIVKGAGTGSGSARANLERLAEKFSVITKGLSDTEQAAVSADLDSLRSMVVDKDITVASPGNLHPYDLEAPAKILVPRFTPLRNELSRQKGQGTAREYRRILGYTNAGMGGIADQTPFFNSESDSGTPTFGVLALRRGQKIAYAMDIKTANYMEMSLSDLVSWKAQFTNLGFEDTRSLSQMALLWAHLLGEEKAMLWGRGAAGSGYEGAVAAPVMGAPVNLTDTNSTLAPATYFVRLTSNTGQGQSLPNAEQSIVVTAGHSVNIPLTTEPTGAINYGVYMSTTTGTETFQGFFTPGNVVPGGTTATQAGITLQNYVLGGAVVPGADTSSNVNAYDGFLSVLSDPAQANYVKRVNAPLYSTALGVGAANTSVGDKPFQDAFAAMFATVYADPDEVWLAAPASRELADFLRAAQGTTAAYRIQMEMNAQGNATIGSTVTGLLNESSPTRKVVDLRIHPYMLAGASFIRSRTLPIPDSNIGDTSVVTEVQGYMAVDWPEIQFTYDASTYWYGTLVHYAPKWNACLLGIG